MKYKSALIIACAAFSFFSCDKKKTELTSQPAAVNTDLKNGLPSKPAAINGYMFASYQSASTNYSVLSAYCTFSDPASNLMASYNHDFESFNGFGAGNVSVNNITCNRNYFIGSNFVSNNSLIYTLNSIYLSSGFDYSSHWQTIGNGSFKPLDIEITRGFPRLKNTTDQFALSINSGYSVSVNNYLSNFDSVVVQISNGSTSEMIRKAGSAGTEVFSFSKSELSVLNSSSYGTIYFAGYNYSNKTINSKIYVFELESKFQSNILINP